MSSSRREFLQVAACSGSVLAPAWGLSAGRPAPGPRGDTEDAASPSLGILILGGTGFLGPHVVARALARGHTVTLFNRGRTNVELFPELEKLRGDRDPDKGDGLSALRGRTWDAVVDTSGYVPRIVTASAGLLADRVRQYVFISSISALADTSTPDQDETVPVATMEDETNEEVMKHYGPLKALCEQAAERAMPGRTTSIRPGLIVGPRDYSDRFTYWPVRVRRGGEVLAPGAPGDPVQYIDARDLAAFIVRTIEDGSTGVFHATGPNAPTNIAELIYGCKAVTGGDARFTWVDADFLEAHEVAAWQQATVWIPPRGEYLGFHRINIARAIAAGLTSRPLAGIVADTLAWYDTVPAERRAKPRAGLAPEREAEVLNAWHARPRP